MTRIALPTIMIVVINPASLDRALRMQLWQSCGLEATLVRFYNIAKQIKKLGSPWEEQDTHNRSHKGCQNSQRSNTQRGKIRLGLYLICSYPLPQIQAGKQK